MNYLKANEELLVRRLPPEQRILSGEIPECWIGTNKMELMYRRISVHAHHTEAMFRWELPLDSYYADRSKGLARVVLDDEALTICTARVEGYKIVVQWVLEG